MAKRAKSEAAVREAQEALRSLAASVRAGAKDSELPKKLRKALRDVEPLLDRADRKLDKRQAKLVEAARKEREHRAAAEAKAKAKPDATSAANGKAKSGSAKSQRGAPAKPSAAQPSGPPPRRQGPGTTPRTSIAGARARKRARR